MLMPIKNYYPFQIVGVDIAGLFKDPRWKLNTYYLIIVIIDYFTNTIEALSLKSLSAEETTRSFLKESRMSL